MSLSYSLVCPLWVMEGCYKVFLKPSLLQAEPLQLSQLVFMREVPQPFDLILDLLWGVLFGFCFICLVLLFGGFLFCLFVFLFRGFNILQEINLTLREARTWVLWNFPFHLQNILTRQAYCMCWGISSSIQNILAMETCNGCFHMHLLT